MPSSTRAEPDVPSFESAEPPAYRRRIARADARGATGGLGRFTVLALAIGGLGCTTVSTTSSGTKECQTELSPKAPPASEVKPVSPPESRLVVELDASLERLRTELGKRIPRELASADEESIGSPGRATYRVTRGELSTSLRGTQLIVSTPIRVQLELCKPLGPMCVSYGSCSPELVASASVPIGLDENHELGPVRVSTTVKQGCEIAGIDASKHVKREANKQAAKIQRRIQKQLPTVKPILERLWKRHQFHLDGDNCLVAQPKRLAQQKPIIRDDRLITRLALFATLEPCEAGSKDKNAKQTPLPQVQLVAELPKRSSVHIPLLWSYDSLSQKLTEQARTSDAVEGTKFKNVQLRPLDNQMLGMRLEVEGATCGAAWLKGSPKYQKDGWSLGFAKAELLPQQNADEAKPWLQEWVKNLHGEGPDLAKSGAERIDGAMKTFQKKLANALEAANFAALNVEVSEPKLNGRSIQVGPDGLYVIPELHTAAAIRLR